MITRGCSPVRIVGDRAEAVALLAELAEEDPQETLARWADERPRMTA